MKRKTLYISKRMSYRCVIHNEWITERILETHSFGWNWEKINQKPRWS